MRKIFYIILLFIVNIAYGQKHTNAVISNILFRYDSIKDDVNFSYKLSNTKPFDKFTLLIEAQKINTFPPFPSYEKETKLNIKTLSGETSNISGDGIKNFKWSQRTDGYVLDDTVQLKISAYTLPQISTLKHIERSLLFPGIGDYQLRNGWHYFIYGVVSYGLIASSIYLNQQAESNYNLYRNSYDITQSNNLFLQSKQQYQLSLISASVATAIWVFDLSGILLKARKVKKELSAKNSKYYYKQSLQLVIAYSDAIYLNTQNPFEKTTQKANKFFEDQKYNEALVEYKNALNLNPNEEFTKNKIAETNDTLSAIKAREELYQSLLQKADSLYSEKFYTASLMFYSKAIKMQPENQSLKNSIAEISRIINQLKTDSIYNGFIACAETELKNNNYDTSIVFLKKACEINPEICPTQRIAEIQQQKINNEYSSLIKQADAAFKIVQYEKAHDLYMNAWALKNYKDDYSMTQAEKIEEIKEKMRQKKIDDEYSSLIKQADYAFNHMQIDKALDLYNKSLTIKNGADYPTSQIEKIERKKEELEQRNIDIKYVAYLKNADLAMKKREYDNAKELYEQASELKPDESYPKNQIAAIDKKANESKSYGSDAAIFSDCKNAVFMILVSSETNSDEASQGTGFFISAGGIAISNYHVLNRNSYKNAIIYTGENYEKDKSDLSKFFEVEEVLEEDKKKDYVIFKVKKKNDYQNFYYLKLATIQPEMLSPVLAIGNPKGLFKIPSKGFVTQFQNANGVDDFFILTDAKVTHGNSGGPLLNMQEEVVGIITSGIDDGRLGLNYAINIKKIPTSNYTK